jgi:hypothetical protein
MSFQKTTKFVNLLTTDEILSGKEFSLKRKRECENIENNTIDEIREEEEMGISQFGEHYNIETYISDDTKKYIKNDVLLSSSNITPYNNPLLILNIEHTTKMERIESKLCMLIKYYHLQFNNCKTINDNIETIYAHSIKELAEVNTKIDILNTKLNRLNIAVTNMRHDLCVKKVKLDGE